MALCAPLHASLSEHFKGRYGAIEVFDAGKKLSFRVNAPELSEARDFCQFNDLSVAIAAVDSGVLASFDASVAQFAPAKPSALNSKAPATLSLKQALRAGTPAVFTALRAKIAVASFAQLRAKAALPSDGAVSAFNLIEWFKALQADTVALKPATRAALRSLLTQRSRDGAKLLAFSSRCPQSRGALGANVGLVLRPNVPPVYFAVSVDGKSRKELFNIAPLIRDAALNELGYWLIAP
jgi:hypothetical protein